MRSPTALLIAFALVCWATPSLGIEVQKEAKGKGKEDPEQQAEAEQHPQAHAPSPERAESGADGERPKRRFLPQAPLFRRAILRRQQAERRAAQAEVARLELAEAGEEATEAAEPIVPDVEPPEPELVSPIFVFLAVITLGLCALRLWQNSRASARPNERSGTHDSA